MNFVELLNTRPYLLLDGAMGTQLQAAGLKLGQRPETLCFTAPEVVTDVHRRYLQAGSDIIYANTFQANGHKLAGTGYGVSEVIHQAVALARAAVEDTRSLVALDVGPIGELLEPLGTLRFEDAYELYREMVTAGEAAGADLVVFETFTDLYDMKAAVLAAKEHTHLPILSTMTFEENHRTFTGCTVPAMALTLEGLGVDAIGFNCSLGPEEIFPLAQELAQWTTLPMVVKPNAGLPDPATNLYTITPEEFSDQLIPYLNLGVQLLGGCCGTTPEFISSLRDRLAGKTPAPRRGKPKPRQGVCCPSHVTELNGVRVIGERINPTGKKRFQQALREYDLNYILERGIEQQDAGADILDVNVGLPGLDEPRMMADVVKALQGVVSLPLQIDSSDPKAIEAGLRVCNGKAIVNSVNGKREVLDTVLPIVKKYGAGVVGLTMDENGVPQTAEARFAIAERILNAALSYGIPREDVYIDCLTLTVSAQQNQAVETLKAVRWVKERLGLHTVLGVSNISFGLPDRIRITQSFLTQAMYCGLDLPIVNPNQAQIMDTIAAYRVLSGEDTDSAAYIQRFANTAPSPAVAPTAASAGMDIDTAIAKGLKDECARLTRELLQTKTELEIINELLIPALDRVGDRYEKGEIFLPQLINSANASCEAFEVIKTSILNRGGSSVSKGKIIVATVQGDIHDIGKNIVKVILENYGYQVIDLGRDVPVERVVEETIRQDVHLVGLSALMTTTVSSMSATIQALRDSGHPCKIWVGGAVLTPEYAAEIGADYYAKDAKQSVDIAKEVLG
ncbi:MAG: homocysteine S-methyltransferase family protein [Clostridiales bacterium]|nr:homocysteine S-methyltransferase family protein [Clostridiales bacterium]